MLLYLLIIVVIRRSVLRWFPPNARPPIGVGRVLVVLHLSLVLVLRVIRVEKAVMALLFQSYRKPLFKFDTDSRHVGRKRRIRRPRLSLKSDLLHYRARLTQTKAQVLVVMRDRDH